MSSPAVAYRPRVVRRLSCVALALACVASALFVKPVTAVDFTLTDEALLMLDDDMSSFYGPEPTAEILETRDIPGPGVEYDVQFKGVDWEDTFFFHVSTTSEGNGDLVGLDASPYEHFALQFDIISIDGLSSPDVGGTLIVGALLGPLSSGHTWAYRPEAVDLGASHGPTTVSATSTALISRIETIGWTIHFLDENEWSPDGTLVTLRVSQPPDAVAIPEPGALALGLFAALVSVSRRGPKRR